MSDAPPPGRSDTGVKITYYTGAVLGPVLTTISL